MAVILLLVGLGIVAGTCPRLGCFSDPYDERRRPAL